MQVGRGLLMGGADIIPGVSGGTVALILGIYEKLVTSISHIDRTAIDHVLHFRLKEAAEHINLRFLIPLGIGIGGGVLILEVSKQVPRPSRPGLGQVISNPLKVLEGMAGPNPEPVRRL